MTVWEPAPAPAAEVEPAESRCPVCGKPVKAGSRFCMSCGASIPAEEPAPAAASAPSQRAFCKSCGNPLRPGDKFCMKCGTKTDA